mgnify:FL=1
MDKLKYELNQNPNPSNEIKRKVELNPEISNDKQLEKLRSLKNDQELNYRPERDLTINPELANQVDLEIEPSLKNENDFRYNPEQNLKPKLEPEQSTGVTNDNDPTMTEEECMNQLESILTPELMAKFVMAHYAHDDGNDTPPSSAELEESFRSFVTQLGFRGPKIEGFVKRAMTVLDDFDVTDKYDNIDQTNGLKMYQKDADIDYTSSLAGLELEVDMQDREPPDLGPSHQIKNPHLNNPYYINPNKKPTPFD